MSTKGGWLSTKEVGCPLRRLVVLAEQLKAFVDLQ